MLEHLRPRSIRHALVTMLVILSAFIAVERAQAIINSVQHGLAINHAAPVLELAVADHDHHVHSDADDGLTNADDEDQAPGPHHHHFEGPQIAALPSPVTVEVAESGSEAQFIRPDSGSPQSRNFGLERPPKALVDQA